MGLHPLGPDRITRHNQVRDVFYHTLVVAGVQADCETRFLLPGDETGLKPADCFSPAWTGGRDTSFDVVTVHPCQLLHAKHSAVTPGYSLNAAHNRKLRHYQTRLQQRGVAFFPLAVCTFGSWHTVAQEQIKRAAGALARHTGQLESTAVSHLWRRLSVTLQKANSAALASRMEGTRPSQGGAL